MSYQSVCGGVEYIKYFYQDLFVHMVTVSNKRLSQGWCCTVVTPDLERLGQDDVSFGLANSTQFQTKQETKERQSRCCGLL